MRHNSGLIRKLVAFAIPAILFISCENGSNSIKTKEVSASEINVSPIRHDSLSKDQLAKIKEIQIAFAEVNPSTLDETIDNFKRDQNPDGEIAIWLDMVKAYKGFLDAKAGKIGVAEKKEAYTLILLRSMMPEEEAKTKAGLKLLSDNDVKQIFSLYAAAPDPIKVEKK